MKAANGRHAGEMKLVSELQGRQDYQTVNVLSSD